MSPSIFVDGAISSGGDAEGDVVGILTIPGGAPFFPLSFASTNSGGLVGSAQCDSLGGDISASGLFSDPFIFTGNGGDDVFQITGVAGGGAVMITDFDNDSGSEDQIDLRPLGATASDLDSLVEAVVVNNANGSPILSVQIQSTVPSLSLADFLSAPLSPVSSN
ncbi:hypothetical protein [Cyanobium sp. Morenito 9A2]|uniref:hypothetical protein n=1 Tax=Cyanobium sp. Morenito 9A2 TaxID=2823718 RepID=UPI0020CF81B2|nr:hypothetical protein [Cyanobium sp. Morenito 9A2]MCP9848850.1 hypothetical protein [Cyanobium sp. Morenito 9A2]